MKKINILIIIIAMVLCSVSCKQIEDTNGSDNTDLGQITMEDITGVKHSFTSVKTLEGTKSKIKCETEYNKIFGIHEDEDVDYKKLKGGPCSGTKVLMATKLDSEQIITLSATSYIESGNMQVFLLSPSKEVVHEFENESSMYELCAKQEGEYIVIMGAESFVGNIEVERYFE